VQMEPALHRHGIDSVEPLTRTQARPGGRGPNGLLVQPWGGFNIDEPYKGSSQIEGEEKKRGPQGQAPSAPQLADGNRESETAQYAVAEPTSPQASQAGKVGTPHPGDEGIGQGAGHVPQRDTALHDPVGPRFQT